jgi:hypothetical protein
MGMRTKKILQITDFASGQAYNLSTKSGVKSTYGIDDAKFPYSPQDMGERRLKVTELGFDSVEGLTYFGQFFPNASTTVYRLLVHGSDHKAYLTQFVSYTDQLNWVYNLTFSTPPTALAFKQNGSDSIILASDDKMVLWKTNYNPYTIQNAPIITSMCMNDGALFCTIKQPGFKIWYAKDFNAENVGTISKNSGYISLEDELGYATKIVSFKGDVYVIREYGITKLNYVRKDISFTHIFATNTRIYPNTVSVCGNLLLFMSTEGMYAFNGSKVSRLNIEIQDRIRDNEHAVASSLGSKYYLGLNIDFKDNKKVLCENDEHINNALFILDVNDLSFELIRGVDIKGMLPVKTIYFEKMLVIFNGTYKTRLGEIIKQPKCFGVVMPKKWIKESIFEDSIPKIITKLQINSSKGLNVKLKCDNREYLFKTYKDGLNEFTFKVRGVNIDISVESNQDEMEMKKILLEYYED